MQKRLTKDYVAGYIENVGCFSIVYNTERKKILPSYKIRVNANQKAKLALLDNINAYAQKHLGFYFKAYKVKDIVLFQINKFGHLEAFIKFIDSYCELEKDNQKRIRNHIKLRRCCMEKIDGKIPRDCVAD